MKRTKTKIAALMAVIALTMSLSACGSSGGTAATGELNEAANALKSEMGDEAFNEAADAIKEELSKDTAEETEAPAATSAAETTVFKAEHPADAIYNTSIEPNISDDIKFKVVIREDNDGDGYIEHNVPVESLRYDGGLTIDDMLFVPSDEYVYTVDVESDNNSYGRETPIDIYMKCNSIRHINDTNDLILYIELATESGDILSDSSEIRSSNIYNIKAITGSYSAIQFYIIMPDGSEYEIDRSLDFSNIRRELNDLLGTTREQISASTDHNNNYIVLKNHNWTLIMDNGGYGDSAKYITLINNNI